MLLSETALLAQLNSTSLNRGATPDCKHEWCLQLSYEGSPFSLVTVDAVQLQSVTKTFENHLEFWPFLTRENISTHSKAVKSGKVSTQECNGALVALQKIARVLYSTILPPVRLVP